MPSDMVINFLCAGKNNACSVFGSSGCLWDKKSRQEANLVGITCRDKMKWWVQPLYEPKSEDFRP